MKSIIVLALFVSLIGFTACENTDLDFNSLAIDTLISNNYSQDAKSLLMNEIITNTNHPNYYNPTLDTVEINKIIRIINAVYNLHSVETDSIFNFYKIHSYYCYSFSSINLNVDTNLAEIQNLSNGIFPTGNAALDNMLNTYQFDSVKTAFSYPSFPWLTIYTKNEYNMIPVERDFNNLPQILNAEFDKGCIGDGMNIKLLRTANSATIIFSIGWGDCPAGCIHHRYWEFNVTNNFASFVREYGN